MGTSSPRPERPVGGSPMTGRLSPLALDRARARLDDLPLSVAMAGLSQPQIRAVAPVATDTLGWIAKRLHLGRFLRRQA